MQGAPLLIYFGISIERTEIHQRSDLVLMARYRRRSYGAVHTWWKQCLHLCLERIVRLLEIFVVYFAKRNILTGGWWGAAMSRKVQTWSFSSVCLRRSMQCNRFLTIEGNRCKSLQPSIILRVDASLLRRNRIIFFLSRWLDRQRWVRRKGRWDIIRRYLISDTSMSHTGWYSGIGDKSKAGSYVARRSIYGGKGYLSVLLHSMQSITFAKRNKCDVRSIARMKRDQFIIDIQEKCIPG